MEHQKLGYVLYHPLLQLHTWGLVLHRHLIVDNVNPCSVISSLNSAPKAPVPFINTFKAPIFPALSVAILLFTVVSSAVLVGSKYPSSFKPAPLRSASTVDKAPFAVISILS